MDITDTLAPTSDQLDAVDLLHSGPRVFTIVEVSKGNAEQPVNIRLAEFPRVWRPGKSMRRVLAACWGTDASQWAGRKVVLYCDERVKFGSEVVGGTRISYLSHIDKRRTVPLLVTRGKSASYPVEPLTSEVIVNLLRQEWKAADPARKKAIETEVNALQSPDAEGGREPETQDAADPQVRPSASGPICPDCAQGKHAVCQQQAWDNDADEPVACGCGDESHAS